MKYRVDLTHDQIWAIQKACEFYSRFLAGQWEIPDAMEVQEFINQDRYPEFWSKRNYIEDQMKVLSQMLTGLPIHASYGIDSVGKIMVGDTYYKNGPWKDHNRLTVNTMRLFPFTSSGVKMYNYGTRIFDYN